MTGVGRGAGAERQDLFVAGHFLLEVEAALGPPHQGIEPVDRRREACGDANWPVQPDDVDEFVLEHRREAILEPGAGVDRKDDDRTEETEDRRNVEFRAGDEANPPSAADLSADIGQQIEDRSVGDGSRPADDSGHPPQTRELIREEDQCQSGPDRHAGRFRWMEGPILVGECRAAAGSRPATASADRSWWPHGNLIDRGRARVFRSRSAGSPSAGPPGAKEPPWRRTGSGAIPRAPFPRSPRGVAPIDPSGRGRRRPAITNMRRALSEPRPKRVRMSISDLPFGLPRCARRVARALPRRVRHRDRGGRQPRSPANRRKRSG